LIVVIEFRILLFIEFLMELVTDEKAYFFVFMKILVERENKDLGI